MCKNRRVMGATVRDIRRWLAWSAVGLGFLGAAVPAVASTGVYVTNANSNTVSQFDVGPGGLLGAKTPASVGAGSFPVGVALSPDGHSAFVPNFNAKTVSVFEVGLGGALVARSPATVAAGTDPIGVAVSPDGRSVYVTNALSNTVSQYDVGADGGLSAKSPATVATGIDPGKVAVSPDGRNVYVTNVDSGTVSQYDVTAGGVLSAKTPATVAAGTNPYGVVISPNGESVYVTNAGSDTVEQYSVGAGGNLTAKTPATVAAGDEPEGLAVSSDASSLYVANENADTVSQFDVGADGKLAAKTPASVGTADQPESVAASPDGRSVYVTNQGSNSVSQFDVGSGGTLAAKSPATVATGSVPFGVAVAPDQGPTASFAMNPAPPGTPTSFDATASVDSDGSVVRYDWDFGDGTTQTTTGPGAQHTYATAGAYTVRLTVTDDAGCSTVFVFTGQTASCNGATAAAATQTVTIQNPAPTLMPAAPPQHPGRDASPFAQTVAKRCTPHPPPRHDLPGGGIPAVGEPDACIGFNATQPLVPDKVRCRSCLTAVVNVKSKAPVLVTVKVFSGSRPIATKTTKVRRGRHRIAVRLPTKAVNRLLGRPKKRGRPLPVPPTWSRTVTMKMDLRRPPPTTKQVGAHSRQRPTRPVLTISHRVTLVAPATYAASGLESAPADPDLGPLPEAF